MRALSDCGDSLPTLYHLFKEIDVAKYQAEIRSVTDDSLSSLP